MTLAAVKRSSPDLQTLHDHVTRPVGIALSMANRPLWIELLRNITEPVQSHLWDQIHE